MSDEILVNELDEKTKSLLEKVETLEIKLNESDAKVLQLEEELANLKNQILNNNRKLYGKSSEQVDTIQLNLFNEPEKESDLKIEEPTLEEVVYKRRKKGSYTGKKDNLANLERVVIEHRLTDEELKCDDCGSELVEIGEKSRKEVLKYIPAKLIVEEHIMYSYICKTCDEANAKSNILSTKAPATPFYNSMATSELVSHVIALKHQYAIPLYRQESYFDMLGVTLSRQTLCNWTMMGAKVLEPIYNHIKENLLNRDYIHADETTLQVLKDDGKESKSKKYMWLYMSEIDNKPVILYDYQPTRGSTCPKNFLGEDYKGYLQTDGYAGYNSLKNATRIYCLAHIRRKFHEVIVNLDDETLKKSRALIGFNYCGEIYKLEKDLRDAYSNNENYYELRHEIRIKKLSDILDKFLKYIDDEIPNALPKSPLGKALDYAKKHVPSLKTVLQDGRLEVDNNCAERAIKPFVIGRKNFLFSNTAKGANSSATLYSIIETAKANNLYIENYLTFLFDSLANNSLDKPLNLEELMPWSENLPSKCRLTKQVHS